jgi:hypothetical protein
VQRAALGAHPSEGGKSTTIERRAEGVRTGAIGEQNDDGQ